MRRRIPTLVRASCALLTAALLAAGCAREERPTESEPQGMAMQVAPVPGAPVERLADLHPQREQTRGGHAPAASALPGTAALTQRMLVRNVSLSLVVADVDSAAARVERLVAARGGFVASSSLEDRGGFPWRHYTLRVPSAELDPALAELRRLAVKVTAESQAVEDVTDQAVDLQARLRTLRATEEELLGLLKDARARGQKAEDVMAVYRELTGIRTQVEQYQGQLESLQGLAALSTVVVQLQPDAAAGPIQPQGWRPGETVRNSVRQLAATLRGLGDFVIWALIVPLPIVLALALAGTVLFRVLRRATRRRDSNA